jgi:hypothetical protein
VWSSFPIRSFTLLHRYFEFKHVTSRYDLGHLNLPRLLAVGIHWSFQSAFFNSECKNIFSLLTLNPVYSLRWIFSQRSTLQHLTDAITVQRR